MSSGAPCGPRRERRRREQAVEPHRERGAVLRREERVELEHAELAQRRLLHLRRRASRDRGSRPALHECSMRLAAGCARGSRADRRRCRRGRAAPETKPSISSRNGLGVGVSAAPAASPTMLSGHTGRRTRACRSWSPTPSSQRPRCARCRCPTRRGRPSTSSACCCGEVVGVDARLLRVAVVDPRPEVGGPPARETSGRGWSRSPFGSMSNVGTPASSASSISTTPRPVLPDPVMPTITPWVVKSLAASTTAFPSRECVAASICSPM